MTNVKMNKIINSNLITNSRTKNNRRLEDYFEGEF